MLKKSYSRTGRGDRERVAKGEEPGYKRAASDRKGKRTRRGADEFVGGRRGSEICLTYNGIWRRHLKSKSKRKERPRKKSTGRLVGGKKVTRKGWGWHQKKKTF